MKRCKRTHLRNCPWLLKRPTKTLYLFSYQNSLLIFFLSKVKILWSSLQSFKTICLSIFKSFGLCVLRAMNDHHRAILEERLNYHLRKRIIYAELDTGGKIIQCPNCHVPFKPHLGKYIRSNICVLSILLQKCFLFLFLFLTIFDDFDLVMLLQVIGSQISFHV